MKKLHTPLALLLLTGWQFASVAQSSLESDPAYLPIDRVLDLNTIHPQVNVNLPRFLLKDVAPELNGVLGTSGTNNNVDVEGLIKDVKLIRVLVIEANKTNRADLEKGIKILRADLDKKWTPIVTVPEENVGVYAMGDPSGESMSGIAVLVYDKQDAVIANVVGHVSIGKIIRLASQMNKMPKDLLKKLQGFGQQAEAHAPDAGKAEKAGQPAEGSEKQSDK